jgi:anhydro-N-acetylmuramic acid kinase
MATKTYKAIGLMSGSSMDGLDIACIDFEYENGKIKWNISQAETFPYSEMWQSRLINLPHQNAMAFSKTHTFYGHYLGQLVNEFISKHNIEPDFIASHGHTIFHSPEERLTVQIGDGAAIAVITGYPVVSDFRTQDIALGGEGAPVAPIADKYLLPGYDFYLNLGGIDNISCNINGRFVAFDIGSANQTLNAIAQGMDMEYDEDGRIAKTGELIEPLFRKANAHEYFKEAYPKSLANQFVQENLVPLFVNFDALWEDKMRTACEHIAFQIANAISVVVEKENFKKENYKMIITGGGALNSFLVECIRKYCENVEVVIPDREIIEFKEAALMALMGLLRIENQTNTLHSVTGAKHDTVSGAIHQGSKKMV